MMKELGFTVDFNANAYTVDFLLETGDCIRITPEMLTVLANRMNERKDEALVAADWSRPNLISAKR
jgi:hypothetical protein